MTQRTLYQALLDSDPARLRIIARLWKIPIVSVRRADIATELADALANTAAVDRMLAELTEAQRAALDELLRHEGTRPWAIFVRRWGPMRPVGAGRVERENLWQRPVSPAEALWFRGLVHRAFTSWPQGPVEMAYIPEGLRLYLPAPAPLELPPPPPGAATEPLTASGDRICEQWLTWLQASHARRPLPPIPHRVFLETLALEQGWIRRNEAGAYRPAAEPTVAWLRSSPWEQWSAWFRAWSASTHWNELAHVPTLDTAPHDPWPNEPQPARTRFLAALRHCQPGASYHLADFTAYVHEHFTDFLRPDGDYTAWSLYVTEANPPQLLRGFESWRAVEGALVRAYLLGPLTWLGAVAVSPQGDFRLTEAGAAWLELTAPPAWPAPPRPHIEPTGEIVVPLRRRYARFQLHRVAHQLACDAAACRYRLTPESLARAKRQRITPQRVRAFLAEITGEPLPPSILEAVA